MRIGGLLIEEYEDFGRFVENYRERSSPRTPRSAPNYVYLLLHTMAHHFAQTVVEFSGLEHGSIGEYIFPADLAFLVYRKGMTPDLGNLSAMWRNQALGILNAFFPTECLSATAEPYAINAAAHAQPASWHPKSHASPGTICSVGPL